MAWFSLAEQGGTPVDLPLPGHGVRKPLTKVGGVMTNLSGGLVQHTLGRRRQWVIPYHVTAAEYAVLEAWVSGAHGLGPYELREDGGSPILVNVIELADPTLVKKAGRYKTTLVLEQVVAT